MTPPTLRRPSKRSRVSLCRLRLKQSIKAPEQGLYFNPTEFEGVRKEVGLNHFTMSPSKWIEGVNAIGLVAQSGRYGGT